MPDPVGSQDARPTARDLYERGDLIGAARAEADAADRDGYYVTANMLRDLVVIVADLDRYRSALREVCDCGDRQAAIIARAAIRGGTEW